LKKLQDLHPVVVLTDGETWPDVPAKPMSLASINRYAKASFSIGISRQIGTYIHL